jgi:hypothetical protein
VRLAADVGSRDFLASIRIDVYSPVPEADDLYDVYLAELKKEG